jgi:AcrR family transcriptional regulator
MVRCVEILIENGYAGFTIDGLAARTGVSRPTIYRRWPRRQGGRARFTCPLWLVAGC